MKTMAIRLDDTQHAQLGVIAQLEELTVTDAIRQAVTQWVEARRDSPGLRQRAQAVLEGIEQEAASRRSALAALLGDQPAPAAPEDEPPGGQLASAARRPRGKGGRPASS